MAASVAIAAGPAAVNLGSGANFAVLAKTGISTTGTTSIVGDIGVSPAAATFITGFGLILDASNTFSTSSLVTGKIYAADYASPTPAYMTTAVLDMQTAYTDAAGRTLPTATELGAGDITSMTLAPGLYKWGTGVLVSAAGVTISGTASDVWIFQIAQNLTVANGAIVTLSGGAQAKNIFWQVAGQVTLGTTAAMKGNILCQTLIEMQTGATLNGRALAQTAVTLDANAVTKPAGIPTAVENELAPIEFSLSQNIPNPFNPTTSISFTLAKAGKVTVEVYNMAGQKISTLVNTTMNAGNHSATWNASKFSAGVYFYTVKSENYSKTMKMTLLK
ncbi:MAG: ice-binding family protein [Candidatus Latescibacter sp.]|nr:ice-binding family protein [Candidatus Latescibacter sp.]